MALSFRVPAFSKRFRSSANAVPDAVRRRAVILTSRIAAGDEAVDLVPRKDLERTIRELSRG